MTGQVNLIKLKAPVTPVSEPGTPLVQMDPFLLCQVQAGLPQTAHLHHHHDISSIFNSSAVLAHHS